MRKVLIVLVAGLRLGVGLIAYKCGKCPGCFSVKKVTKGFYCRYCAEEKDLDKMWKKFKLWDWRKPKGEI